MMTGRSYREYSYKLLYGKISASSDLKTWPIYQWMPVFSMSCSILYKWIFCPKNQLLIMCLDRMNTGWHHSRWCWIRQSPSLQSSVSWWQLSRFAQKFHPKKAILPELKLRSLSFFSPSPPKFSSNHTKHKVYFFKKDFQLAVISIESTEQGQRFLWYNCLLEILHQSQRLPRMTCGKSGVMRDKKGSFYCGSWSEG